MKSNESVSISSAEVLERFEQSVVPQQGVSNGTPAVLTGDDARRLMLRESGLDTKVLKKAVNALKRALTARKRKVHLHEGTVVLDYLEENSGAQLEAAKQTFDLFGAFAPRQVAKAGPPAGPTRVLVKTYGPEGERTVGIEVGAEQSAESSS